MFLWRFKISLAALLAALALTATVTAQTENQTSKKKPQQPRVRTVTVPISIFTKDELKGEQTGEILEAGEIIVRENNEQQTVLSIRSVSSTPLHLAVLLQDNLASDVNLQLEDLRKFIRKLPPDSRVMVAYLRAGTSQVVQKFTPDLERAAKSLRAVIGSDSLAPNSPYEGVEDLLKRFDAVPTGRRAILMISDGLDRDNPSVSQSVQLDEAILKAQRRGVAVYGFYFAASGASPGSSVILRSQGNLQKIADETGGRAYFQGTLSPISFDAFFKDLNLALLRQFALTYLSTHPKKGYYKLQITSTMPEVRIEHPKGYYFRGN